MPASPAQSLSNPLPSQTYPVMSEAQTRCRGRRVCTELLDVNAASAPPAAAAAAAVVAVVVAEVVEQLQEQHLSSCRLWAAADLARAPPPRPRPRPTPMPIPSPIPGTLRHSLSQLKLFFMTRRRNWGRYSSDGRAVGKSVEAPGSSSSSSPAAAAAAAAATVAAVAVALQKLQLR